ncbi:MAG TPA: Ig-like domain-containing protein, partial [Phycisphaerae bacterium]|nr:Ig-like domain-containing protein [Phycisphaerae bacterium]
MPAGWNSSVRTRRLPAWSGAHSPQVEALEPRLLLAGDLRVDQVAASGAAGQPFDKLQVQFNQDVQEASFTLADIALTGPGGAITPAGLTRLAGDSYEIDCTGLTGLGQYSLRIGPGILDLSGQAMNQDGDATPGEASDSWDGRLIAIDTAIADGDAAYDDLNLLFYGAVSSVAGEHSFADLLLQGAATLGLDSSTTVASALLSGTSLLNLAGGTTLTVEGELRVAGNSRVVCQSIHRDAQVGGLWVGEGVTISAGSATIEAGSQITADAQGYLGAKTTRVSGLGPGAGQPGGGSYAGAPGAGYGGVGGDSVKGQLGGPTYGSADAPLDLGSGGSSDDSDDLGGDGGGAIRMTVGGHLQLDGEISADGQNGFSAEGGGGSGGSIWLTVNSLGGLGSVSANGGGANTTYAGGGGGGRVRIETTQANFLPGSNIRAAGGTGRNAGQDGTISVDFPVGPRVTSTLPPDHTNDGNVDSLAVNFSSPLDAAGARDPASYALLDLGADRRVGGGDDTEIAVTPVYTAGSTQVRLDLPATLGEGLYQLTLYTGLDTGIRDPAGHPLDQDQDGVGGDFLTTFDIDFTDPLISDSQSGLAIVLDGTNDYFITPNLRDLLPTASVTLELWFNAAAPGVIVTELGSTILNSGHHDSHIEIVAGGEVRVRVWNLSYVSLGAASFDEWHHVALRYDAATGKLDGLLDGVASAGSSTGTRTWPSPIHYAFGATEGTNLGSGAYFRGQIDEVRIWDSALSDQEIQSRRMQALTGGEAGLVACYPCTDGVGTVVSDLSPNARHATAVNGPVWQPSQAPVGMGISSQSVSLIFVDVGGMNGALLGDPAHYQLWASGGDGTFGDGNEIDLSARIQSADVTLIEGGAVVRLNLDPSLEDEYYQVTVEAAGIFDLAGNVLNGGADFVSAALPFQAVEPTITIDLQPGSDSGMLTDDDLTNVVRPVFDVTVNKRGLIEIDFDGDGTFDEARDVADAGSYVFATPTDLADGLHNAGARFSPWVGDQAEGNLDVTIDTAGPSALDLGQTVFAPYYQRRVRFDEAIDPATFTVSDTRLFAPGAVDLGPAAAVSGAGADFVVTFDPLNTAGQYALQIGPSVTDLAGNPMNQDGQGANGQVGADEFVDGFQILQGVLAGLYVAYIESGGPAATPLDKLVVIFSQGVDDATLTVDDVTLAGVAGDVAPLTVTRLGPQRYELDFTGLTSAANYTLTVGPDVRTPLGVQMDQDHDAVPGEAEDAYQAELIGGTRTVAAADDSLDDKSVVVAGGTLTIDGPHDLVDLLIQAGGTVTHSATTTAAEYRLDLTVSGLLWIEQGSKIDVSARGYTDNRTVGNTTTGGATGGSGGSYGGLGRDARGGTANWTYGDYRDPNELGSGGGGDGSNGAGSGGGLARLDVGLAAIDGSILANGGRGTYLYYEHYRGGGSGGGIRLDAEVLTGSGWISADGGGADSNGGGSGGGGRVAVYYGQADFDFAHVTAHAGTGGQGTAAVGTAYIKDAAGTGELRVDSHGTLTALWTPLGLLSESSFVVDRLVLAGAGVVAAPAKEMPIQANEVFILNGAVLTHRATTTAQDYSLRMDVTERLWIDAASRIDVSARGYTDNRTLGNTTTGGATGGSGGSYGGLGRDARSGTANWTYGDYRNPNELGSGGAGDGSSGAGSGGGLVRLTVSEAVIDGAILANGGQGTYVWYEHYRGAGSGGGIRLDADSLSGEGWISANGGNSDGNGGGSGGGGRVAVYYQTSDFDVAHITAHAGTGGQGTAAVGTTYIKDAAGAGELRVDSHGTLTALWTPLGLLSESAFVVDRLVIAGAGVVAAPAKEMPIQANQVSILNGGTLTHRVTTTSQEYSLRMQVAGQLWVDADSRIDASARGYVYDRTVGNTATGAATGSSGGTYGGYGLAARSGATNQAYGDYLDPDNLGSGGAGNGSYGGGSGGGLIRISAASALIDGAILAEGEDGEYVYYEQHGGGGSGGGIRLDVGTLEGSGHISVDGGGVISGSGGSGGGGRVAVYYDDMSGFTGEITSHAGSGGAGAGAAGTVYAKDTGGVGELRIDSHGTTTGIWTPLGMVDDVQFTVDRLVLSGDGVVAAPITEIPIVANEVSVLNQSVLTHRVTTTTQAFSLRMTVAGQLLVDADSRIDVSGRGYIYDRTVGNTTTGAATAASGGSYGGFGAAGRGGTTCEVYGDYRDPDNVGSGGAGNGSSGGGSGGGLIRISAGSAVIDGEIRADGADGIYVSWDHHGGGGSGGGIRLDVGTISGAGLISVDGGTGSSDQGGSGGGGRVAVYYGANDGFDLTQVTARAGAGGAGNGAVGTIYLKAVGSMGELWIDSRGGPAGVWTPLGVADDTRLELERLVVSGQNVVAASHHQMVIQATHVSIINQAVLTHRYTTAGEEHSLRLEVAGQLLVDATSKIDVSGRGYIYDHTVGNTTTGAATGASGGSYGGYGAAGRGGATNQAYGDYLDPACLGSGGAGNGSTGGGSGGGLIRIAAGTALIDGQILADAAAGTYVSWDHHGGGGSGGGIRLDVGTLVGDGLISANGAGGSSNQGGAGGGGRIAVYYDDISGFDISHITTHAGSSPAGTGAVGTVYLKDNAGAGELLIDSHGTAAGVWTPLGILGESSFIADRLVLSGAGVVAAPIQEMAIQVNQLSILNGAVLTHQYTTTSTVYSLRVFVTGELYIDATSRIDVSGRGYNDGYTVDNTAVGGATGASGASYGGLGAAGRGGATNALYGNPADPAYPGSGGAGNGADAGGHGGGLLRIAAGSVRNDGEIRADGADGFYIS